MFIENLLLDHNRPYDHEPISRLPEYIRETRKAIFIPGVRDAVFEPNVQTFDAVWFDASANVWRRSLSEHPERSQFQGIAFPDRSQIRIWGMVQNPSWNFAPGDYIYVSNTVTGGLISHLDFPHGELVPVGRAVTIDVVLIDSTSAAVKSLYADTLAAYHLTIDARDATFIARDQAVGAAATATAAACQANDLVAAATAGFMGFQEGFGYDLGCITAPCTYFNQNWGLVTDPV